MGSNNTKVKVPNNPFDVERFKREQYILEYEECEREEERRKKDEEKRKKVEEKQRRRREKLEKLKIPTAPHVPAKTEVTYNDADYNLEAIKRMQNQLALDSQTFILNQLMLSVQFFGNYEKEMWDSVERNRMQENEETNKIEQYCKIVILPDRLHEAVDRRVKFKARYDPARNKPIPLHTQTLYVVHENIEITNPGEPSVYSILCDAPIYKMEIDEPTNPNQKHHVGYIRLKSSEIISNPNYQKNGSSQAVPAEPSTSNYGKLRIQNGRDSEADDDDDEEELPQVNLKFRDSMLILPRKNNRLYSSMPNGINQGTNSTSSASPPSSEYDYAYITALHTRQPLSIMRSSTSSQEPFSTTTLPQMCITSVPIPSAASEDYDSDDDEDNCHFEVKQYLNSKAFLAYFINMFYDNLANDFGITKENLSTATWKGSVIYSPPWEIVPAIACPWPKDAFEWIHRQREIKENPITRQKFQWPTPVMVNKVIHLGCHVIPLGFAPKSGINTHRELEWKIVFPEADRYLESCLTSTQVKVYIITKALIETFVQPHLGNKNMFTSEHLRTHLFWQCENNYAAWPEDYLGEALVRFLNSLLERMKRQRLPDYFLPKRNLFENIPEKIMVELHKGIYRITENPVMHLMIALKNLQFTLPTVKLNYKKIYSTITIDDPLKILNPNFQQTADRTEDSDGSDEDEDAQDPMGIIGYYQKVQRTDKKKRRLSRKVRFLEAEKVKSRLINESKRVPQEPFNVRHEIPKHMEKLRRIIMYNVFIEHFIKMADESIASKSYNQATIYLKQASRLCSLMQDDDEHEEAKQFLEKIELLQCQMVSQRNRDSQTKPQLPVRESVMESSNKIKFRVKTPKSPTTDKDEYDPYTNIEQIQSTSFSPDLWSDEDDDDDEEIQQFEQKYRKSILASPKLNNGLRNLKNKSPNPNSLPSSPKSPRIQTTSFVESVQVHANMNEPAKQTVTPILKVRNGTNSTISPPNSPSPKFNRSNVNKLTIRTAKTPSPKIIRTLKTKNSSTPSTPNGTSTPPTAKSNGLKLNVFNSHESIRIRSPAPSPTIAKAKSFFSGLSPVRRSKTNKDMEFKIVNRQISSISNLSEDTMTAL